MYTIDELLTNIRAWANAVKAFEARQPHEGGLWHAVQKAAERVTGSFVNSEKTYFQFVALADEVERLRAERDALQSRINAALAIEARDMADTSEVEEILQAGGWNAALEEVQKALTIDHVTGVDKLEQVTDDHRP